jgi:hypothetical protein
MFRFTIRDVMWLAVMVGSRRVVGEREGIAT